MSVRISLILEASEMFLSLHMIFSLERAAVGMPRDAEQLPECRNFQSVPYNH